MPSKPFHHQEHKIIGPSRFRKSLNHKMVVVVSFLLTLVCLFGLPITVYTLYISDDTLAQFQHALDVTLDPNEKSNVATEVTQTSKNTETFDSKEDQPQVTDELSTPTQSAIPPLIKPAEESKETNAFDPKQTVFSATNVQVPVLTYHSIVDPGLFPANDTLGASLRVHPDVLEAQLQWLQTKGYTTITIDELLAYAQGKGDLPDKPVMLTFDDGWMDNYDNAFRLLKKYNMKGNFAIVTSLVGVAPYMVWPQIIEIYKSGMGIMSHSVFHCTYAAVDSKNQSTRTFAPTPVSNEPPTACDRANKSFAMPSNVVRGDLRQSKQILEQQIGGPVSSIVYPFGNYNRDVMRIAREEGYLMGFTTEAMNQNTIDMASPMNIGRIHVAGQASLPLSGLFAQ